MSERIIDWNNYEENFRKRWAERDLEKSKSGSISFINDQDKLTNWEIYHAHWETYLTSDYWKNWREKINSFSTEKEVDFYTNRLRAIMEFIQDHTRKNIRHVENAKQWDSINTPKLIEQELQRLENISEEEFRKTDKWSNSADFRELTIQEISDMLDYTPNDKKAGNFSDKPNDSRELNQSNSVEVQKANKGIGTGGIIAIVGLVGVIGAVILVKKRARK